jgi:hypothetical protein
VHYWINNAGINGGRRNFMDLSSATIEAVVKVRLLPSCKMCVVPILVLLLLLFGEPQDLPR